MDEFRWQCPGCRTQVVSEIATADVMRDIGWQPIGNVVVEGWRVALCPPCAAEQARVTVRRKAS